MKYLLCFLPNSEPSDGDDRMNTRKEARKLCCPKPVSWEISSKFPFAFKVVPELFQVSSEAGWRRTSDSLRTGAQESATYWLCELGKFLNFSVHQLPGV